ncbi:MAG: TIGR02444 family protein [Caulobacter sp.]|nr:TIGR02444 family protein [Caulobacter sp.]
MSARAATFWDWALAAYARPGVPDACLSLQDDHGQQTAYLLWAAWAAPGDAVLATGAELARHWELTILGPLRQSRRALKPALPPVDDTARLALREEVKAVELAAERLLMESLEALAGPASSEARASDFLSRAAATWGDPPPPEALETLARALA